MKPDYPAPRVHKSDGGVIDSFGEPDQSDGRVSGPPGVGKTLTVEAISECLKRPLYIKAILLFDEADVFVEWRSADHTHRNALVSVFLRKLEYYKGILFLTTNRVQSFNEAIVNRIHFIMKYGSLNENARKEVWKSFLEKANTEKKAAVCELKDFNRLACMELNRREIKNIISVAQAFTAYEKTQLGVAHLERAINASNEFQSDFKGAGPIESKNFYG
ncbi:P-loop containing nucleoside triphosphate hydrolase protein [Zopfia rhizophila CBS 207.26]|uniref:P-loop containing nucleoside triphosphate hydrolase protein n=1 Tax=Zopfia rhizophila CBS 207.26 TaxID=1314779 RepID=A0A6A6E3D7_9PEZI|nr:P-loop containing nucleoside triphosphate hydrolase protein [Zopfia rhizophila CBS 207.26]